MKEKDFFDHWSSFSFRNLKTTEKSFSFWWVVYLIGSQWEANGVKNVFLHDPESGLSLICERKDKDAVKVHWGEILNKLCKERKTWKESINMK